MKEPSLGFDNEALIITLYLFSVIKLKQLSFKYLIRNLCEMRPIGSYFSELPTNEESRSKDANVCSYVWAECGYRSILIYRPGSFHLK